jgi:hypothetical protein
LSARLSAALALRRASSHLVVVVKGPQLFAHASHTSAQTSQVRRGVPSPA